MWQTSLGALELRVEHRRGAGSGGPTLRVCEAADSRRELMRFDCFERGAHFHLDVSGSDEISAIDAWRDPVEFCIGELRRDLPGYLERSGFVGSLTADPADVEAALRDAEAAMRNPPIDLDALDLAELGARFSEKWNTYGSDILPAWVAEMDFPLAAPIRRALGSAIERSDLGYPISARETGVPELFAARMHERFGWEALPQRTEVISDVVQGIFLGLRAFSDGRDGVLVQTPIYPPFLQAVRDTGHRLVENRMLQTQTGWEIDLDSLRRADERTGFLLLCNPHNPSGRVLRRSELEALAEIAVTRRLTVISDEIHADLVHGDSRHIPFASLGPEVSERTLTLTSASKAFNIPGLRCAVAHFGTEALQQRFHQSLPRRARGGVGILGLSATRAAWKHSGPWLEQVRSYLASNRIHLRRELAERFPGVRFHEPEASYLAWLDFSALDLPDSPARILFERGRVALSDGRLFGAGFECFARLNFATSRSILDRVLDRMQTALGPHD